MGRVTALRFMPVLAALSALALSAPPAFSTSFVEQPFPDTVQQAPVIVRGKVGMGYADWIRTPGAGKGAGKQIWTYTELDLEEVFKGDVPGNPKSIVIRELGGEKDGIGMQVPGAAQFERGEDVVVTLGPQNPDGSYTVQGMMMGKFTVERDSDGQEYLAGAGLGSGVPGRIVHDEDRDGDSAPRKWTLEALRGLIREQARESSAPAPAVTPRNPAPRPSAAAGTSRSPLPVISPSPAPALQSSPEEAPRGDSPRRRLAGLVGAIVIAIVVYRAVRRRPAR